ncbi:MAG: polysaccharide pyruvyl transferase family protein [Desulfobulbus sp.]|jgi:polysaccharide pyruvyl transferase WcaK-like protein|nr:polysaccharide pyruvyl transferase family protein [Desulfobulbus sp.]
MSEILASDPPQIVVLGASFGTGNLGVSALAWSTLKLIKTKWPEAGVALLGVGREPNSTSVRLTGNPESLLTCPVRYSLNILARNHILGLLLWVVLCRLFPMLGQRLARKESTLGMLLRSDLFCDITGGDSFSDIYGLKRLLRGFLLKTVCQLTGKPFVLLPQTYGPFAFRISRVLARQVLRNAAVIYSRDSEGVQVVRELISAAAPVRLCPDVAFVLDPIRPDTAQVCQLEALRSEGAQVLGLNISGLLYHGGYSRDNMFGLACDYPALIADMLKMFCAMPVWRVLLVPHVLPSSDFAVEDDQIAAEKALAGLPEELRGRVMVLERGLDQNETKYCIGLCDFFIGARMHATIAALSQAVPAIGLAYSRKFAGVFATAGVPDCVLDLRGMGTEEVMRKAKLLFDRRKTISEVLNATIPPLQAQLMTMFDVFEDSVGE